MRVHVFASVAILMTTLLASATCTAESITSLRSRAEKGDVNALFDLGAKYYNGDGVARDFKQAALYLKAAADKNDREAQYNLGAMYYFGEGVHPRL